MDPNYDAVVLALKSLMDAPASGNAANGGPSPDTNKPPIDQTAWTVTARTDPYGVAHRRSKLSWDPQDATAAAQDNTQRVQLSDQIRAMTTGPNAPFRIDERGDIWDNGDRGAQVSGDDRQRMSDLMHALHAAQRPWMR